MNFYYDILVNEGYGYEDEDTREVLCFSSNKLMPKDFVVIEFNEQLIVAKVKKSVDKLEALTSRCTPREIIQKVEITEYQKRKNNELQRTLLIQQMNDKMSEVKMMEQLKKYSDKPGMAELYEAFTNVTQSTTHTTEETETIE